jgi:hypothetical protein
MRWLLAVLLGVVALSVAGTGATAVFVPDLSTGTVRVDLGEVTCLGP